MRKLRARTWLSIIGMLLMTITLVAPQSAAAQAGGSRQIINGQTLSWNAEWALAPDVSFVDQDIELVGLTRTQTVVGYGATSFPAPGDQVRDVLLDAFTSEAALQQVDRGTYENVSYSLDISPADGFTLALFTLVVEGANSTSLAVLIDEVSTFQSAMEGAQGGITINGTPIFDGVDAAVMQQHLTAATGQPAGGNAPTPTPAPPTPAPPAPTPTPEPIAPTPTPATTQPTQSTGTGTLLDDLNSGLGGQQPTPAQTTGQQQTTATTGAPANSVTIASSGVEIRYSDDWSINLEEPNTIQFGSTGSLWMVTTFFGLEGAGPGETAQELAENLLTIPDLVAPEIVEALDLENDRRLIVMVDRDPVGDVYMIYDSIPGPTATTAFLLVVDTATVGTAVDIAQATLQIDGQPVLPNVQQIVPSIFTPGS